MDIHWDTGSHRDTIRGTKDNKYSVRFRLIWVCPKPLIVLQLHFLLKHKWRKCYRVLMNCTNRSTDIKRWTKYEVCGIRKVWLEIFGVPPHGWNGKNLRRIAELWGRLICLGKSISRTDTFESMKVLVVTDRLHSIQGDLILQLEDSGYSISIKEVGPSMHITQNVLSKSKSSSIGSN